CSEAASSAGCGSHGRCCPAGRHRLLHRRPPCCVAVERRRCRHPRGSGNPWVDHGTTAHATPRALEPGLSLVLPGGHRARPRRHGLVPTLMGRSRDRPPRAVRPLGLHVPIGLLTIGGGLVVVISASLAWYRDVRNTRADQRATSEDTPPAKPS